VGNNPLKYTDPTGHGINTISNDEFFKRMNKDKTSELNIWVGDAHQTPLNFLSISGPSPINARIFNV
jgi:hypothetical protein